jgi:hypothetical protein
MIHKIITTENYLLVVDDLEIKENNYVYVEGHVKPQMCKGFENNGDVLCYNNLPYIKEKTKKVISHLPLNNSPILEGVDLLPPLEDDFMPAGFECEINNPMFALSLQPQITTNPQGLTQWVGEYIY